MLLVNKKDVCLCYANSVYRKKNSNWYKTNTSQLLCFIRTILCTLILKIKYYEKGCYSLVVHTYFLVGEC